MPAAARVQDQVYVDDPDGSTDYGHILVGSPNVFINEGNATPVRVGIPQAVAMKQMEELQDYIDNPSKYKQPDDVVEAEQVKPNYAGTPDTTQYKMEEPPPPAPDKAAPSTPTPNLSGDRFSFVGGNQSAKAFANNPEAGGVTVSYPGGWNIKSPRGGQIVKAMRIPNGAHVLKFLDACLAEKQSWVETGMGGGPSNPKIVNIWRELGFPNTAYWKTDQTAWCAGFVHYALKKSGFKWLPEAGAKQTLAQASKIGAQLIPIAEVQPGDIVLWSYSHVNFCYKRW